MGVVVVHMGKGKFLPEPHGPIRQQWSPFPYPSARHQLTLQDHAYGASASHGVTVYAPAYVSNRLYCLAIGRVGESELPRVDTQPCQGLNSRPLARRTDAQDNTHTHTENRLMALRPELPGWAGTWRNIHPLTPILFHQTSFINFLHLLRSTASSSFNLRAWRSFSTTSHQVLFGLPLGLRPSTSYFINFFTQSSSSFHNTCPYQRSLFLIRCHNAQENINNIQHKVLSCRFHFQFTAGWNTDVCEVIWLKCWQSHIIITFMIQEYRCGHSGDVTVVISPFKTFYWFPRFLLHRH